MSELMITNLEDAPAVPFEFDGRIMYSSGQIEVIHLALKPGERMESHTQPFGVIFFVISGNAILDVGRKPVTVIPGTCIHVPAGARRSLGNNGPEEFRVLVIKDLK